MRWRSAFAVASLLLSFAINVVLLPLAPLHAQTQTEQNAVARKDFERADADLNKTYQALLVKLQDAESKEKLRETERAWVASRDAKAEASAKEAADGSMAPTLRYQAMTDLTRERIKELKAMLDHGVDSEAKAAAGSAATAAAPMPESANEQAVSETERTSSSSSRSVSPDKQWEYKCEEYGLGQCAPEIVRAGTSEVVLDLDEDVYRPEAGQAVVVWAPDSKRFAFNYSPPHAHHTSYETVAFYQLRGDKWEALHSPADDATQRLQLAQFGEGHLPKDFTSRRCSADRDTLKLRTWSDANTAIIYAPCYGRTSGELEACFLFTLKFDAAGKWKIVNAHRMSKEELKAEDQ
jgi:uncharacterized protein YecT (DUF1311 family)